MRSSDLRLIGFVALVGAFALLGLSLAAAWTQPATDGGGMMDGLGGMMGSGGSLSPLGMLLVIASIILIVFAFFAILWPQEERAATPGSPTVFAAPAPSPPQVSALPNAAPVPPAAPMASPLPAPEGDRLLRLLEGDERRLFMRIQERGGVVLQKDLVTSSAEFSKAKVTRLLDKLERKGLVARERAGMTNRIRIVPPEQRTG